MRRDARMLAALFERPVGLGEAWEVSETWSGEVEGGPDEPRAGVAGRRGHAVPCPGCGVPCGARDARERTWRHPGVWQSGTYARRVVPRTDCPGHGVRTVPAPWEVRPSPHPAALLGDRALAARARGTGETSRPGGPRPHTRHARPRRREVRAARPTEATGHRAPHVRPDLRPTAATGRRPPRPPATCRAPSPPASPGRCRRRHGPQAAPAPRGPSRGRRIAPGAASAGSPTRSARRPGAPSACGPSARRARRGDSGRCARGSHPTGATSGRPGPARRPRRCATPADGRRQGRRGRCPTGCPAGRRAPTSSRRGGSPGRSGRREGIPGYLGGRPADAYPEGANSLIQSIKKAARGFRNVEYLATAIFPGLGGLSFGALACAQP